jgi:hypothetical protein
MAADDEFTAALDRLIVHDYVRLVSAVAQFSGTMMEPNMPFTRLWHGPWSNHAMAATLTAWRPGW